MFCGECGTKNEKGAQFCENCGAKLAEEKQDVQKSSSTRNPKKVNGESFGTKLKKMPKKQKILITNDHTVYGH